MKKEVINDLGKTSRSIVSAKGPKVEMILLLSLKKKKKIQWLHKSEKGGR